jgi:ubiquinone/menaquinone biosynthesis C-methylase UbiE
LTLPDQSTPDQQAYWNANLDPQNLGGPAAKFDYVAELAFYKTPDQLYALEQLAPLPEKLVLEIGAGIGTNALYLAGEGARIVAIDIAEDRLRELRQLALRISKEDGKPRKLQVVKAAAEHLPFRAASFDRICSKSVMIHTRLEQSISETFRVAASDATCVFIEPRTNSPLVNLYRRTLAPQIWRSITNYFTDYEISLFRNKFPDCDVKLFYVTAFLAFVWQFAVRSPALFRISLPALTSLDAILLRLPVSRRWAWFAVLVCKKA